MPHPSPEAIAEYERRIDEIVAARKAGGDVRAADADLKRFMRANGLGEGVGFNPSAAPEPPADATPAEITAAIIQARIDGDDATADALVGLAPAAD